VFHHEPGRFAFLALRNAVLGLVTLGLYRFWGKTRIRRHLWSHVSLLNEPFEYLGTGKELFLGFLFALAVLLPISFARSLAEVLLAGRDDGWGAATDVVFLLVIYFLIHLAVFRARRYRLSRTMWRGVRAGQTGSALRYGLLALAFGFVTAITAGLGYPLLRLRLMRYRMGNTWFGDRRFRFDGRAGPVLARWLAVWGLALGFIVIGIVMAGAFGGLAEAAPTPEPGPDAPAAAVIAATAVAAAVVLVPLYAWYRVAEFRYFVSRTGFDGMRFRSTLPAGRLVWIYLSYLLAVLGLIVLGVMIVGGGSVALGLGAAGAASWGDAPGILWGLGLFALLVFLVGLSALQPVMILLPTVRWLCATLSGAGEVDFQAIAQSRRAAPGRGEGLADMLDVGSF
jgi:uncharacterized membrane protein YjgN (DUF898 family)